MNKAKVGITGIQLITGLGYQTSEVIDRLLAGETGLTFSPVTDLTGPDQPASAKPSLYGKADFDYTELLGGIGWRHYPRAALMACWASQALCQAAGIQLPDENVRANLGILLGYSTNYFWTITHPAIQNKDWKQLNPAEFIHTTTNAVASLMSIRLKIHGYTITLSSGVTAGLEVLALAGQTLMLGRAEKVIAGGVEEECPEIRRSFARQLQGRDFADAVLADENTGGMIGGEACALLLMETAHQAEKEGREIQAYLQGFGMGFSPLGEPGKNPQAARQAVLAALADAGLAPEQIDAVFLSANGDPSQEAAEAEALIKIFGKRLPAMTAIKGAVGETLHAGGALAAGVAILTLTRGYLPPTKRLAYRAGAERLALLDHAQPCHAQYVLIMSLDQDQRAAALILHLPQGKQG